MLRNCAQTLSNSNSPLGDYYRRMRGKGGGKYAVCATAHKIAAIIYTMVRNQQEYDPSKVSVNDRQWLEKRIMHQEMILKRLKNRVS